MAKSKGSRSVGSQLKLLPAKTIHKSNPEVPSVSIRVEADKSTMEEQVTGFLNASSIKSVVESKSYDAIPLRLILTTLNVRYSPANQIPSANALDLMYDWSSALLESKLNNDEVIIGPKLSSGVSMDGRTVELRLLELSMIACSIRYLAMKKGMSTHIIEIDIDPEQKKYLPRFERFMDGDLWIAHDNLKSLVQKLYPELDEELIPFPRVDLPDKFSSYSVGGKLTKELLLPFTLLTESRQRFILTNTYAAQIVEGDLTELEFIADKAGLSDRITLNSVGDLIMVNGWKQNEDKTEFISNPSYEAIILYFISLKVFYKDRIDYDPMFAAAFDIKIVKNSLWTTPAILDSLITNGLLNHNSVKKSSGIAIGDYEIYRYPLMQTGMTQIASVFGEAILQSEFIVRPFRKAEIISLSRTVLELAADVLDQNPNLFKINQRSITNIVFECLTSTPYVDIMKVYFTVKFHRGIVLVSEMNPQNTMIGKDAFESISENTEFGGGVAPVHIVNVERNNPARTENFLIGNTLAINAILGPIPGKIKQEIVLQEITPGVLGRRLSVRAFIYIQFMLN